VIIRPATITDARRIAEVHVETWRAAYRGQIPDSVLDALNIQSREAFWTGRLAEPASKILAAVNRGAIIGFCDLIPTRDKDVDGRGTGEIAAIYVQARFWRKGTGRALVNHALAEARRCGYEAVTLWVLATNDSAKKFYTAMGFRPDGAAKTEKMTGGTELQEVRFRLAI
jgi:GNAT superfamily N-acetyltransferase